jgi:hypothetical protein
VILVLAIDGGASGSAVLETGHAAPIIPAARALAEISRDRSHVPERRRAHETRRLRERREARANQIVRGEIGDADRTAKPHRTVGLRGNVTRTAEMPEVNELRRANEPLFHRHEEVGAAAERERVGRTKGGKRGVG